MKLEKTLYLYESFRESGEESIGLMRAMENNNVEKTDENDVEPVINYRGIKAMPFILGNETFEKLGTVGSVTNLVVYLTTVFNMKSLEAVKFINIFNGTASLATLVGAFLSDAYIGRYNSLAYASIASFLGMTILTLTAAISSLHPPKCAANETSICISPTAGQLVFLISAFVFLVIGAAGIRPCNLAFGADQFNPNTESGKRGITSFFNWYFFTYTFSVMVTTTGIVYVQSDVSWAIGLAIPAFLMFISCALFFLGTRIYVIVKPQGSPLTGVAQVLVAAIKKRRLELPEIPDVSLFNHFPAKSVNSKLLHTDQFKFLDKSAIITDNDEINLDGLATNPWKLCSIQQVEEVKCIMRTIPIWAACIICSVPIIQQQTYAVLQALQSDRHLGTSNFQVPAATYTIFIMITLTIWIPIYDRIVVPYLERITGKVGGITLLQRIGVGMILSILCMLVSGLVEERRRQLALNRPTLGIAPKGGTISSMSGMWLVPQLAIAGLSEGFSYVAQVEFFYKQFPENMRSIAQSFFFVAYALASYLSSFLVTLVHETTLRTKTGDWLAEDLNKGRLDYFYFMIAGLGILNFAYFLVCAKWYRYKC